MTPKKSITPKSKDPRKAAMERFKQAQTIKPEWQEICDPEVFYYVQALANSIGCPEEHLFFPLLSVTAALVSTNASVQVTESWFEPAVLWFGILARQGEMKAPSMNILLKALAEFEVKQEMDEDSEREDDSGSLILDERQYDQSALRDILARHENRLLMITKDMSFLCENSNKSPISAQERERKYVLSSVYNGQDPDFASMNKKPMCLNVAGFMEPKQVVEMMSREELDPVIGHILFSSPSERDCLMEDLTPVPKFLPPLSLIFSIIYNANKQPTVYRFEHDALALLNEYLNELMMWKRSIPNDENRRYILTKARAQFCRLTLICHVLRDGLREAITRWKHVDPENASKAYQANNQWRSAVISAEAVQQAREMMIYFTEQKFNFLPPEIGQKSPKEVKTSATPTKLKRDPPPCDSNQQPAKQAKMMPQKFKPQKTSTPETGALNSAQPLRNQPKEPQGPQRKQSDDAVHTPKPRKAPAPPNVNPFLQQMSTYAQQLKAAWGAPAMFPGMPGFHPALMAMGMGLDGKPYMPQIPTPTTVGKSESNEQQQTAANGLTSQSQTSHGSDSQTGRSSGRSRKNPNPNQSHDPFRNMLETKNVTAHVLDVRSSTPSSDNSEWNEEYQNYEYNFSQLLPNGARNVRSLLSCGRNEIRASIVAGHHLMPPTETPGTKNRYKTEAAIAYLEKVSELGFGKVWRKNKRSTVFCKKPFDELDAEALKILQKIDIMEQDYRRVRVSNESAGGQLKKLADNKSRQMVKMQQVSGEIEPHLMKCVDLSVNQKKPVDPVSAKEEYDDDEPGDLVIDDDCSEHSSYSNSTSVSHGSGNSHDRPPVTPFAPLNLSSRSPTMPELQPCV